MSPMRPGRRTPAIPVLFGALLAGTALYLVPALVLNGQTFPAIAATLLLLGLAVLGLLHRRERGAAAAGQAVESQRQRLHRALLDHSGEAHLVLDPGGNVLFASANLPTILGIDPEHLEESAGLLDLIRDHDRRRVLKAFASLRRQPGMSVTLEVAGWHPDGGNCFVEIRGVNLVDSPTVGGLLVTIRDITPRKTVESEIEHLAYYDAITGLANRRFFFEQGTKALSLAKRHRDPAAVFFLDLDRFKQVEDRPDYIGRDELLERVAEALQETLRDTDIVARLGADEFAVVLTEVRDVNAAAHVAHRLLDNLPTVGIGDRRTPVAASLGVAMFPDDAEDLESLLKAADIAMYRAKAEGSGVEFYRPELRTLLADQMRLEQDLKRGLERHELHLHYQPIYHLLTGELVGAEALSRWRHLARGTMPAANFIGLAERAGLIRSLDRWAVGRAVHQLQAQLGRWDGWVGVNLSAQSITDPNLPAFLRDLLADAELRPGSLVLEIPETAILADTDAAADLLWELKNTGVAIALDDFGIGATSFSVLKRLPVDILKLHPVFVAGIGKGEGDEHLVEAAISIAHGIRARVLAKGVEHDDQAEWLRDAGCDFLQGFLTGPAVPIDELDAGGAPLHDLDSSPSSVDRG